MTPAPPPRLAAWLLRIVRGSRPDDALIGDLDEEYQARQSAVWYWTQALGAIVLGPDVRAHMMVLVAPVTGALAYGLLMFPVGIYQMVNPGFRDRPWTVWTLTALEAVATAATGWVVGRIHHRQWGIAIALNVALDIALLWTLLWWAVVELRGFPSMQDLRWMILTRFGGRWACLFLGGAVGAKCGRKARVRQPLLDVLSRHALRPRKQRRHGRWI